MRSIIYINEAKFIADSDTIDLVVEALEEKGFVLDVGTGGYISPEFYHEQDARDASVYGPWGAPNPPFPS